MSELTEEEKREILSRYGLRCKKCGKTWPYDRSYQDAKAYGGKLSHEDCDGDIEVLVKGTTTKKEGSDEQK